MSEQDPHYDVVIIGGGVSGIGAACHLRQKLPHLTFIILESRDSLGGTWDFYKYPGVRTDSDMYTMAYSFNPWKDNKTTASASAVNSYLKSTADLMNIPDHVRFNEKVEKICWSSKDSMWTIHTHRTKGSGSTSKVTGRFVFMCAGYTNFNHIHKPDIKNIEAFKGRVVHPQSWPDDLDYADKEIVVIGSGATAVTLVPALADAAKHVTMLQRSPSYILQLPNIDPVAAFCARYLPASIGNTIMRCKNIFEQQVTYAASRVWNDGVRNLLILGMKMNLKKGYDVKAHFTPKYPVLTQRLCLSPDTDFTDAINNKGVTVITDSIDCVTETGIQLASGTRLDADIIVTATGFDLCALGGVQVEIDGVVIENAASSCVYKGQFLLLYHPFFFLRHCTNTNNIIHH